MIISFFYPLIIDVSHVTNIPVFGYCSSNGDSGESVMTIVHLDLDGIDEPAVTTDVMFSGELKIQIIPDFIMVVLDNYFL